MSFDQSDSPLSSAIGLRFLGIGAKNTDAHFYKLNIEFSMRFV